MVLVVTGQLVSSYDEEFRRLYARSTVPPLQALERPSHLLRDSGTLQSPKSSQLSLHQLQVRSRGAQRAPEERLMTRGLSIQERLHQAHHPDMGVLLRGHSYGEDLQRLNSLTRLRMGAKELGIAVLAEKTGPPHLRAVLPNRLSQQQLKHWSRYGADQNLIPFSSESSLHRWRLDTYLRDCDAPPDASCDAMSPVTSPFSSHMGLNELQSQLIHSRSRDIKSRMEEIRQKRLSLQEFSNFRQSQELLRPPERPSFKSSLRGLDVEPEAAGQDESEPLRDGVLSDDRRATSYYDVKTLSDPKTTCSWNEPLLRTTSAGHLDVKLKEPPPRFPQPGGLGATPTKPLKSLTEIPEEKEGSGTINGSVVPGPVKEEGPAADETAPPQPGGVQRSLEASGRAEGPAAASSPPPPSSRGAAAPPEQPGEAGLQRKNSFRMKMYSFLTPEEKKQSKKEDKAFQRKASLKPKHAPGLSPPSRADQPPLCSGEHAARKSQPHAVSRTHSPNVGPTEAEKHRSLQRAAAQRSSKRKSLQAPEPGGGGRTPLEEQELVYHTQKVYSRFEYLLTTQNLHKDRSSTPACQEPAEPGYQGNSAPDRKLGKFMQRVGNLIGKNK